MRLNILEMELAALLAFSITIYRCTQEKKWFYTYTLTTVLLKKKCYGAVFAIEGEIQENMTPLNLLLLFVVSPGRFFRLIKKVYSHSSVSTLNELVRVSER